jgi:hypothetical protein
MRLAGATISVFGLEAAHEGAAHLVNEFQRLLGFSGKVSAYCWISPPGGGVSPHWDGTSGLMFQVAGSKRWRIHRHVSVPWPMQRGFADSNGKLMFEGHLEPWEREAARYSTRDSRSLVMRPGDVLYIPPGTWHSTEAEGGGDSLGFGICFDSKSVCDLLKDALSDELMKHVEWRHHLAQAMTARIRSGEQAPVELRGFIRERADELRSWIAKPGMLEIALENEWRKSVAGHVGTTPAGSAAPSAKIGLGDRLGWPPLRHAIADSTGTRLWVGPHELEFDEPGGPSFARGLARHRSFSVRQALQWTEVPRSKVLEWLQALMDAGILIRIDRASKRRQT